MPLRYLRAFIQMRPIIEAQEAIGASTVMAFGSGRLRKADASRIDAEWRRQARLSRVKRRSRSPIARELFAALGIPVVEQQAQPAEEPRQP